MSKVVRIHEQGAPEVMRLEDIDIGAPGAGELRVRIEAIGLNRSEAAFRAGQYPVKPKFPAPMGYEACGVVEALGDSVKDFRPGDRVSVLPTYRLGEYGVYAESAIVPARSVVAAPPGLSPIEAASIWMQYFTAMAILEVTHATVGDYVIIRAASSSVGLAAIQLANWAGATPIAATRRSDKRDALLAHGAKHVIATEESDLVAEVMKITDGKGARIVFDPVGGPYVQTLAEAMAERHGARPLFIPCDLTDIGALRAAMERIREALGPAAALVNNAANDQRQDFASVEPDAFDWTIAVNLRHAYFAAQAVAPQMRDRGGGSIINMSSVAWMNGVAELEAYSAAKAAISNFTQWLAVHMAQNYSPNIRVNAIAPGFFITDQNRFLLTDKDTGDYTARGKSVIAHTPMNRFGTPEDLLGATMWLISPAAAFVTGIVLPVDGGFSAFSGV